MKYKLAYSRLSPDAVAGLQTRLDGRLGPGQVMYLRDEPGQTEAADPLQMLVASLGGEPLDARVRMVLWVHQAPDDSLQSELEQAIAEQLPETPVSIRWGMTARPPPYLVVTRTAALLPFEAHLATHLAHQLCSPSSGRGLVVATPHEFVPDIVVLFRAEEAADPDPRRAIAQSVLDSWWSATGSDATVPMLHVAIVPADELAAMLLRWPFVLEGVAYRISTGAGPRVRRRRAEKSVSEP